jgi:hypothetical protein
MGRILLATQHCSEQRLVRAVARLRTVRACGPLPRWAGEDRDPAGFQPQRPGAPGSHAQLERNAAMETACSEAVGGLLASPLSAMRCYTEGMASERTGRDGGALFRCRWVRDLTGEGWQ